MSDIASLIATYKHFAFVYNRKLIKMEKPGPISLLSNNYSTIAAQMLYNYSTFAAPVYFSTITAQLQHNYSTFQHNYST